ncbi:hypothetical protein MKZ38_002603 [Zalerion maritima]|uniref:Uncharacterized protein n=1 Tax=Zalerion maritima TaxID=339359 RepID=A0AAD5WSA4_9PEZI|nr:hypothetical protein MKZ38_002603 [Zalerion maritima]
MAAARSCPNSLLTVRHGERSEPRRTGHVGNITGNPAERENTTNSKRPPRRRQELLDIINIFLCEDTEDFSLATSKASWEFFLDIQHAMKVWTDTVLTLEELNELTGSGDLDQQRQQEHLLKLIGEKTSGMGRLASGLRNVCDRIKSQGAVAENGAMTPAVAVKEDQAAQSSSTPTRPEKRKLGESSTPMRVRLSILVGENELFEDPAWEHKATEHLFLTTLFRSRHFQLSHFVVFHTFIALDWGHSSDRSDLDAVILLLIELVAF